MRRWTELGFLFRVVAIVELTYAATGLLTPPSQMEAVTGWVLSPDGVWIAKLFSVALASQAWIAWVLRDQPHRGVAQALAFYQLASATTDWVIWLTLDGVFSTTTGQVLVVASIATHYTLGVLMVRAIRLSQRTSVV